VIKLARLRDYHQDPQELPRQMRALEDNVADAVKRLDAAFLPNFAVTRRESNARAIVGELVVANPVSSDIVITFPSATVLNAGKPIAVKNTGGAFTVTIAVVEGTVSGAASELLAAGTYLYISDGGDWGRIG
jgi:hypothetical protein